jgi:hypothetical protein
MQTQETRKLFNPSAEFVVPIMSGGRKECKVRFPSDAEWCERSRAQRSVRTTLGRGKSQYQVTNAEEVNEALFAKIRLDTDGPEFDAAEASKVIERLERCDVVACERIGDQFRIDTRVLGGIVTSHVANIPRQKDVLEFGRSSVRSIDSRRTTEVRVVLEPSTELYKKVAVSSEGYAAAVPIIHQDTVLVELLYQVEAALEDPEE